MKNNNHNEIQILNILDERKRGKSIEEICFEYGISQATFFDWRKSFELLETKSNVRIMELEKENQNLKRMFAELSLNHEILKDRFRR